MSSMLGRKSKTILHTIFISKDHSTSWTHPPCHIWICWIITWRLSKHCRCCRRLHSRIVSEDFEENVLLNLNCKCMVLDSQKLGLTLLVKIFQSLSKNSAVTMVSILNLRLHMHPKATVVLKGLFKNIRLAIVSCYPPPTYPSTCGIKQSITLTV